MSGFKTVFRLAIWLPLVVVAAIAEETLAVCESLGEWLGEKGKANNG